MKFFAIFTILLKKGIPVCSNNSDGVEYFQLRRGGKKS